VKIFVINPGSTSTRVAVFEDGQCLNDHRIVHDNDLLSQPIFPNQYLQRTKDIEAFIASNRYELSSFGAISARGGRLKPVKAGVYRINKEMVQHAKEGLQGQHPANLAVVISAELSLKFGVPAYTVDPISVDELEEYARYTGLSGIERASLSHALNMKAVAKRAAAELEVPYEQLNVIVVHLGGGGSVSAHKAGRMVDLYNSDQEGPFAVERAGSLPTLKLLEYLDTQQISYTETVKLLANEGGFFSYFKTRDFNMIESMCKTDASADIVMEAYTYTIAKAVGSFLPIFQGNLDALCFTGGVVNSRSLRSRLERWVGFVGRLFWYPDELEMETLAGRVTAVLKNEEHAYEY